MGKPATPDHPIHEILRRRWSPLAFSDRSMTPETPQSLCEASRRAPSSAHERPWSFLVATNDAPEEYDRLLGCLVEGHQVRAKHAPALLVSVAGKFDRDRAPTPHLRQRESAPQIRTPIGSFVFSGRWGRGFPLA